MPKNILQDIKPLTSNSRGAVRPRAEVSRVVPIQKQDPEEYIMHDDVETEHYDDSGAPRSRKGLWLLVGASIIILVIALSYAFAGAQVTITPKEKAVSLDDSYTAIKDGSDKELPFEVIALSGEESKTVIGTETQDITARAKGRVIIYNEYSTAAQPLRIETRLETKDGKIFKTDKAVTVPGYTKKGTTIVPGSVEVDAHADVAGAEYNVGLSDFTIFGFKGSPKYAKFYARSKTAMAGGGTGTVHTLAETEKVQAQKDLSDALRDKLLKQALSQLPAGFIYYDDGIFFSTDPSSLTFQGETEKIEATAKGKMSIVLFNEARLAQFLASSQVSQYDGSAVHVPTLKTLSFAIKDKESIDPSTAKSIPFTLKGDATIVWDVDMEKLSGDLAGTSKKEDEFKKVLAQYAGIDTAEVVIRPFWKGTFPSDKKDIHISVK